MAAHKSSTPSQDELLAVGSSLERRGAVAMPLPARRWATIVLIEGPRTGAMIELAPGETVTLGQSANTEFCIPDEGLLSEHAKVSWNGSGYRLEPLSRCVWIEGTPVTEAVDLESGARIQLGPNVRLRFDLHDRSEQDVITAFYRAALRDRLTGAYNRHYLDERLPAELSFASRRSEDTAVLMIDIDDFKVVNDTFGHPAGDAVLRIVAEQLRRSLRPEDVLVRYGGDEFVIVLRGLNMANASLLAERVLRSVAALRIPIHHEFIRLTLSIGIAVADPTRAAMSAPELISCADRALYRAKREGRNRSRGASEPRMSEPRMSEPRMSEPRMSESRSLHRAPHATVARAPRHVRCVVRDSHEEES